MRWNVLNAEGILNTKPKPIEIVMIPIKQVKPYWKNPRLNEVTIQALVETIPIVGFNQPILVDRNHVIVKGHARYGAAVRLGMSEIPCVITENTDDQNKFDRIADNRVFELSKWDLNSLTGLEANEVVSAEQADKLPARKYTIVCPYCNEMVTVEI